MDFAIWSLIVGVLLVVMALSGSVLARLPLSTAMLYLLVGMAVSPWGQVEVDGKVADEDTDEDTNEDANEDADNEIDPDADL